MKYFLRFFSIIIGISIGPIGLIALIIELAISIYVLSVFTDLASYSFFVILILIVALNLFNVLLACIFAFFHRKKIVLNSLASLQALREKDPELFEQQFSQLSESEKKKFMKRYD